MPLPPYAPTPSPYVPRPSRIYVKKLAVGWGVYWEEYFLASDRTKTKCVSLAKTLNHFMRRSIVMDQISVSAVQDAVNAFAAESTAGGVGYRPNISHWGP